MFHMDKYEDSFTPKDCNIKGHALSEHAAICKRCNGNSEMEMKWNNEPGTHTQNIDSDCMYIMEIIANFI